MTTTRRGMSTTVKQIWLLLGILLFTAAVYAIGTTVDGFAGQILRYSIVMFGFIASLIALFGADGIEKLL